MNTELTVITARYQKIPRVTVRVVKFFLKNKNPNTNFRQNNLDTSACSCFFQASNNCLLPTSQKSKKSGKKYYHCSDLDDLFHSCNSCKF
ncbi:hypothetical protein RIR_jg25965.t1 [Rhizophagus irregularis DAOM 181602=DAOM 197198]|nr:hypothetical protein RIR_jg25965.t1 [Rhizophagus irregularis DAOM 181602=DAOM 197198]